MVRESWRPPDAVRRVVFSPGLAWVAVLDGDGHVDLRDPFAGAARTLRLDVQALALACPSV